MKKHIIYKALALLFVFAWTGCEELAEDYPELFPPEEIAYRIVKGVVSERDTGKKLQNITVNAWECKICWDDCNPKHYGEVKTNQDGTFRISFYGEDCLTIAPRKTAKYQHFTINGQNPDSTLFKSILLTVQDSIFVDIKMW